MRIELHLEGIFQRQGDGETLTLTLPQFIDSVKSIANREHYFSPGQLRQHFGLSFLPLETVETVLKENIDTLSLPQPILYDYSFVFPHGQLTLLGDDLQLPTFLDQKKISGNYHLSVTWTSTPPQGISSTSSWWNSLYSSCQNEFTKLPHHEKIHRLIHSDLSIQVSDSPKVTFFIDRLEVDPIYQQAIAYLQNPTIDISDQVRSIVDQYISIYRYRYPLPQLNIDVVIPSLTTFIIGRNSLHSELVKLIHYADKYLLISSYIIEDEEMVSLISQKALTLPPGSVWILTNLQEKVLDYFDLQEDQDNLDERKKSCISLLFDANVQIRSGNFHLKTYISEKSAYLGSANLTKSSLKEINFEAGILCQGNETHQDLVRYFTHYWNHKSKNEVKPSPWGDELIYSSLNLPPSHHATRSDTLLTAEEYHRDLEKELSQTEEKVQIYTWTFNPSSQLNTLLDPRRTEIYINSTSQIHTSSYRVRNRRRLHAKITLIGDRIAYVGGVNFFFRNGETPYHDLMYKTTDRSQIQSILQQLSIY